MPRLPFDMPRSPHYSEVKAKLEHLYNDFLAGALPRGDCHAVFWTRRIGVGDLIVVWDGWKQVPPYERNMMVREIHAGRRATDLPLGLSMAMTFEEATAHNLDQGEVSHHFRSLRECRQESHPAAKGRPSARGPQEEVEPLREEPNDLEPG